MDVSLTSLIRLLHDMEPLYWFVLPFLVIWLIYALYQFFMGLRDYREFRAEEKIRAKVGHRDG